VTTMLNGAWFARARLAPFKRMGGAIEERNNKTLRGWGRRLDAGYQQPTGV
jgi:hypothetical protein